MAVDITFPAAALAGLVSCLSPCVLPLAGPYLCFMAGTSVEEVADRGDRAARLRILASALAFVAGLAVVFVALGAGASALGAALGRAQAAAHGWLAPPIEAFNALLPSFLPRLTTNPFTLLAGVAILAMGLHFLGAFRIFALSREARVTVAAPAGPGGAFLMGMAFALGWTPCIGPILATILAIAGTQSTVLRGAELLGVYALGLGLPFVVAALAMGPFLRFFAAFKRHMGAVEKVSGALLAVAGVAFLTGGMQAISIWLIESFPALSRIG